MPANSHADTTPHDLPQPTAAIPPCGTATGGQHSYYQQRMAALGITDKDNYIQLWQSTRFDSEHKGENILKPFPIFTETAAGIEIMPYSIHRSYFRHTKILKRRNGDVEAADKIYVMTRYAVPPVNPKTGKETKYLMPKGEPTRPFFPPGLVQRFDECAAWKKANPGQKLPSQMAINALYMTEGYIKAFKAGMHGILCIGVPSITLMKNDGKLYDDITTLVNTCEVERFIWLEDGDCRNLSTDAIKNGDDLRSRPKNFFDAVSTFYDLTQHLETQKYFAHVNTEALHVTDDQGNITTQGPKGLDDLLCAFPGDTDKIAQEMADFTRIEKAGNITGIYTGQYIVRIDIRHNIMRINEYFLLNNVDKFYLYHSERRPDLKAAKNFKYGGTLYRYDADKGECIIEIPSTAADYKRVANDYYQTIHYPDKHGKLHKGFDMRTRTTIIEDNPKFGKEIFKHIQKLHRFVVVPSHTDYQQIINNCWNLYNPFIHEPEAGDCDITLDFIKHIFGCDMITDKDENGNVLGTYPRWELGLDYLTILYKYPQQILPILCLVSRERQTGKTTFVNWLDKVFSENVITIGNEDMEADFNAHWVSKLIICCDETKLDKHTVIQKIKRLSTADKVVMNSKGRDQVTLEFFAKFILNSNDESDFIRIDEDEIRFWVLKVPQLAQVNKDMIKVMMDEIPAFLHYLHDRKMVTTNQERHWFKTSLLETEALRAVKENSLSTAEKRLRIELKEWFVFTGAPVLTFPMREVAIMLKGYDKSYIQKVLHKMGYRTQTGRHKYPVRVEKTEVATEAELGEPPVMTWQCEWKKDNNTFYEFKREDFIDTTQPENAIADRTAGNGSADHGEDLPF